MVAGVSAPHFGRFTSYGLALLTVGLIVQWGAKSHSISF